MLFRRNREEPRGIPAVFFLFLIPGFPKDTLSYILGVSPIPLWAFFLVMTVGRMPGTWLLSIQGAKFQAEAVFGWIPYVVLGWWAISTGHGSWSLSGGIGPVLGRHPRAVLLYAI
ncbi:MAG: VTT domain-containing protein [candidate division NC10 bacterium]|nr:VTT domain-containing protein [candidate division NC10 bacterium]